MKQTIIVVTFQAGPMTIERVEHSGMLIISDIIDGVYVSRRYIGYTKRDAIRAFKMEMSAS